MSEENTYAKVTARIFTAAKEIIEANAPFPKEPGLEAWQEYLDNLEACLDKARDHAWQEVANWGWAIYTYQGFQVYACLTTSEQLGAEFEYWECNEWIKDVSPYELGAAIAFFALVNMLSQEIWQQCEDLQELAQDKIWQLERE